MKKALAIALIASMIASPAVAAPKMPSRNEVVSFAGTCLDKAYNSGKIAAGAGLCVLSSKLITNLYKDYKNYEDPKTAVTATACIYYTGYKLIESGWNGLKPKKQTEQPNKTEQ